MTHRAAPLMLDGFENVISQMLTVFWDNLHHGEIAWCLHGRIYHLSHPLPGLLGYALSVTILLELKR